MCFFGLRDHAQSVSVLHQICLLPSVCSPSRAPAIPENDPSGTYKVPPRWYGSASVKQCIEKADSWNLSRFRARAS